MDNNWNQAPPGSSHMNHSNMTMDWQMAGTQSQYSPSMAGLNNPGYNPQIAGGSMWNSAAMYSQQSAYGTSGTQHTQMQQNHHQMNPITAATASASRCAAMNELESLVMDPSSQRGFSPILTDLSKIASQETTRGAVPKNTAKGTRGGRGGNTQKQANVQMQQSASLYVQQQHMQQQVIPQMMPQQHLHQGIQYQQMPHSQSGIPLPQRFNRQQYMRMPQQFGMIDMPGTAVMRSTEYSGQQPTMHSMQLTHKAAERGRGRGGVGSGRGRGRGAASNVHTRTAPDYQMNRNQMTAEHSAHAGRGYAMPGRTHVASHPHVYGHDGMMQYNQMNYMAMPTEQGEGYSTVQQNNMTMNIYHQHAGADVQSAGYPQYPTGQAQAPLSYAQYTDQPMSNNSQHVGHEHSSPAVITSHACSSHSAESSQHPSPPKQNNLHNSVGENQDDTFLDIFSESFRARTELKQITEQDIANELNEIHPYQQSESSHDYQPMASLQTQNPSLTSVISRQASSQPQVHYDSPPQYMHLEQKHGSLPSQYDQNSPSCGMAMQRGVIQSNQYLQQHRPFDLNIYQDTRPNQQMAQMEKHPAIVNLLQSKTAPAPQVEQLQETSQMPPYVAPVVSRPSSTIEKESSVPLVPPDVTSQQKIKGVADMEDEEYMSAAMVQMICRLKKGLSAVVPVEMSKALLAVLDQLKGKDYFVLELDASVPSRVRNHSTFSNLSEEEVRTLCHHYVAANNFVISTTKLASSVTQPANSAIQSPSHQTSTMPDFFGEIGSPQLPSQEEVQSEKPKIIPTVVEKPTTSKSATKPVLAVKEALPEPKLSHLKTHPVMTRSDMAAWGKHKEKDQESKPKPFYGDESTTEEDNDDNDPDFVKTRRPGRGRGRGRGSRGGLTRGAKRGPGRPRGSGKASKYPNMGTKPVLRGKEAFLAVRTRSRSPEVVAVKRVVRAAPSKKFPIRSTPSPISSQERTTDDEEPVRAAPVKRRIAPIKEPRRSRLSESSEDSSSEKSRSEPEEPSKPSTSRPVLVVPPAPESVPKAMKNTISLVISTEDSYCQDASFSTTSTGSSRKKSKKIYKSREFIFDSDDNSEPSSRPTVVKKQKERSTSIGDARITKSNLLSPSMKRLPSSTRSLHKEKTLPSHYQLPSTSGLKSFSQSTSSLLPSKEKSAISHYKSSETLTPSQDRMSTSKGNSLEHLTAIPNSAGEKMIKPVTEGERALVNAHSKKRLTECRSNDKASTKSDATASSESLVGSDLTKNKAFRNLSCWKIGQTTAQKEESADARLSDSSHEEQKSTRSEPKSTNDAQERLEEEERKRLKKEKKQERKRLEEERQVHEEVKQKREKKRKEGWKSREKEEKTLNKKLDEEGDERDESTQKKNEEGRKEQNFDSLTPEARARLQSAAALAARKLEIQKNKLAVRERKKAIQREKEEEKAARKKKRKIEKKLLKKSAGHASPKPRISSLEPNSVIHASPKPSASSFSIPKLSASVLSMPRPISIISTSLKPSTSIPATPKPTTSVKLPMTPARCAQLSLHLDTLLDDAGAALEKKRESQKEKKRMSNSAGQAVKKYEQKSQASENKTPRKLDPAFLKPVSVVGVKDRRAPVVVTPTSSQLILLPTREDESRLTLRKKTRWGPPNLELSQSTVGRLINATRASEVTPQVFAGTSRMLSSEETKKIQDLKDELGQREAMTSRMKVRSEGFELSRRLSAEQPKAVDAEKAPTTGSIWVIPPIQSSQHSLEESFSDASVSTGRSVQLTEKETETIIEKGTPIEQFGENVFEPESLGKETKKIERTQGIPLDKEPAPSNHSGYEETTTVIPLERSEVQEESEASPVPVFEEGPCSSASLIKTSTPVKDAPPVVADFGDLLDAPHVIPDIMFSQGNFMSVVEQGDVANDPEVDKSFFGLMSPVPYEPSSETLGPYMNSPTRFIGAPELSIQDNPLQTHFMYPNYNRDFSLDIQHNNVLITTPTIICQANASFYDSSLPNSFMAESLERSETPKLARVQPFASVPAEYKNEDALDELEQMAAVDSQPRKNEQEETSPFIEDAGPSESFGNCDSLDHEEEVVTTYENNDVYRGLLFGQPECIEETSPYEYEQQQYDDFQDPEDMSNRANDIGPLDEDIQASQDYNSFEPAEEELVMEKSINVSIEPVVEPGIGAAVEEEPVVMAKSTVTLEVVEPSTEAVVEEEPVMEENDQLFLQPVVEPVAKSANDYELAVKESSVVSAVPVVDPVTEADVEEEPIEESSVFSSVLIVEPVQKSKRGRPRKHPLVTKPLSPLGSLGYSSENIVIEEIKKSRETLSSPTHSLRSQGSVAEISLLPSRNFLLRKYKAEKELSVDTSVVSEDTDLASVSSFLSPSESEKTPKMAHRSRKQFAIDTSTAEEDEIEESPARRSASQEALRRREYREKRNLKRGKMKPEPTRSKEEMEEIDEIFKSPPKNAHRPKCIPEKKPKTMAGVERDKKVEQRRWREDQLESSSRQSSRASSQSLVQSAESESEPFVKAKQKRGRRDDTALLLGANEDMVNELCTKGASRRTRRLNSQSKERTSSSSPVQYSSTESDYQPRRSKGKRRYMIESDDEELVNLDESMAPEPVDLEKPIPAVEAQASSAAWEESLANLGREEPETLMEMRAPDDEHIEPKTVDIEEQSPDVTVNRAMLSYLDAEASPAEVETTPIKKVRSAAKKTSAAGTVELLFKDRNLCASVEDIIKDSNKSSDKYRLSIDKTEYQVQLVRPDADITHAHELHRQHTIPLTRKEAEQMTVFDIRRELSHPKETWEEASTSLALARNASDLLSTPAPTDENVQWTKTIKCRTEAEDESLPYCSLITSKESVEKSVNAPEYHEVSTSPNFKKTEEKMEWEDTTTVLSTSQETLRESATVPEPSVMVEEEGPVDIEASIILTQLPLKEQLAAAEEPLVVCREERSPETTEKPLQQELSLLLPSIGDILDKETTVADDTLANLEKESEVVQSTSQPTVELEVEPESPTAVKTVPAYPPAQFGLEPEDEQVERSKSVEVAKPVQESSTKSKPKLTMHEELLSAFYDIISEKPVATRTPVKMTQLQGRNEHQQPTIKQEKKSRAHTTKSRRAPKLDVSKLPEKPETTSIQVPVPVHIMQRVSDLETLPLVFTPKIVLLEPETDVPTTTAPKKKRYRRSQTEMLLAMGGCKLDQLDEASTPEKVRASTEDVDMVSQNQQQWDELISSKSVIDETAEEARKASRRRHSKRDSIAFEFNDQQETVTSAAENTKDVEAVAKKTENLSVGKSDVSKELTALADTSIQPNLYVDALEQEYEEPEDVVEEELTAKKDIVASQEPLSAEQTIPTTEVKVKRPRGRPRKNKLPEPVAETAGTVEPLADQQNEQTEVVKPVHKRSRRGQHLRRENRQKHKEDEDAKIVSENRLPEKDNSQPAAEAKAVVLGTRRKKKRNEVEQSLEEVEAPKKLRSRSLEGIVQPERQTSSKRRSRSSEKLAERNDDLEGTEEPSFELEGFEPVEDAKAPATMLRKRKTSGPVRNVLFEPISKNCRNSKSDAVSPTAELEAEKIPTKKRKVTRFSTPTNRPCLEVTRPSEQSTSKDYEDRESYSPELGGPLEEIRAPTDVSAADKEVIVAEEPTSPELAAQVVEEDKDDTVYIEEEEDEENEESEDEEDYQLVPRKSPLFAYADGTVASLEDVENMQSFLTSLQQFLSPTHGFDPRLNVGDEWSHVNDGERAMYISKEDEALSVFYVAGAIIGSHSVRQLYDDLLRHDYDLTDWLWDGNKKLPIKQEEMKTLTQRLEYYLHEVNFGSKVFFVPLQTRYGPAVLKTCLSTVELIKYKFLMDSLSFDVNMPLMIKIALLVHLDKYFIKALSEAKTRESGKTMEELFNMYIVGVDEDLMPYVSFEGNKDGCPLAKWAPKRVKEEAWRLYYLRTMLFQLHRVIEQRMFESGWIHPFIHRIINMPLSTSIINLETRKSSSAPRIPSPDRPEPAIRDVFDERTSSNYVMVGSKLPLPVYSWFHSRPGYPANYIPLELESGAGEQPTHNLA